MGCFLIPFPENRIGYSDPAGFLGPVWAGLRCQKSLDKKALGGHWARAFPPVFLQSGRF